jgi:hypothetical protein
MNPPPIVFLADVDTQTVERIGDLLSHDLPELLLPEVTR